MRTTVENRRLTDEEFFEERKAVLSLWKTGKEVEDLDETIAYCKLLPESKSLPRQIDRATKEGIPLVIPRSGLPTVELQIERDLLLQKAGADAIGIPADANGAVGQYDMTERLLKERGNWPPEELLDGFPMVNIGVKGIRQHTEALNIPTRDNNGQLEPRLISEICFAGGITEQLYGALSGNVCYHKDVPLDLTLRRFQYVDRLTDYFASKGVDIVRFLHGHHTVMEIPSLETAQGIIEGLLFLAQQGNDRRPRYLNLDLVLQGDLIQDVAVCRAIPEIAQDYFKKFGYTNVIVNTEACQWSGAFPEDEGRALAINAWQTIAATWGRAPIVVVKSSEEAWRIPSAKANAMGVSAAVQIRELARRMPFPWERTEELTVEIDMFKKEVKCVVDRILELSEDVAVGLLRACEAGVFDAPFLPSKHLKGRILAARDARGAVRILDPGNLPLTKEILNFHQEKLAERAGKGKVLGYRDVMQDILYFVKDLRRIVVASS
jgi:methylaspartate mutase epsilon subunit